MKVAARATVTIELLVHGNWSPNWSVAQVHEDATISAKKRIEELCGEHV